MRLTSPQKKALDITTNCWVQAHAGTGKTRVLVNRLLVLLLNQVPAHKILCLTYTTTAAMEMGDRLTNSIHQLINLADIDLIGALESLIDHPVYSDDLKRYRDTLNSCLYSLPKIQTIHSFCFNFLQDMAFEVNLKPAFSILNDLESEEILQDVIEKVIGSYPYFSEIAKIFHEDYFFDLVRSIQDYRLRFQRIFEKYTLEEYKQKIVAFFPLGSITEEAVDTKTVINLVQLLQDTIGLLTKTDTDNLDKLLKYQQNQKIELLNEVFLYKSGENTGKIKEKCFSIKVLASPEIKEIVRHLQNKVYLIQATKNACHLLQINLLFFEFIHEIFVSYKQKKQQLNVVDFPDLVSHTYSILNKAQYKPWILEKLNNTIEHILVDEAQDTTPDQWNIIQLLSEDLFSISGTPKTIFVVGDFKQSIYSFQDAQPEHFLTYQKDDFKKKIQFNNHKWLDVELNISFRSAPEILSFVDKTFEHIDPKYQIAMLPIEHQAYFEDKRGHVKVHEVFIPQAQDNEMEEVSSESFILPHEYQSQKTFAHDYAFQIAENIHRLIDEDKTDPSKILILFQRRHTLYYETFKALKNKGIAVGLPDKIVLKDHIIYDDMLAFAKFALLPHDDLNLVCLLKSPFFNVSEEEIFSLAYKRADSIWNILNQSVDPAFADIREMLQELLQISKITSVQQFYEWLVYKKDGLQIYLKSLGPDVKHIFKFFFQVIRNFEEKKNSSFYEFLQFCKKSKLQFKISNHQTNGIKIMTVHSAKGLESDIVYLPDTTDLFISEKRFLWDYDLKGNPDFFVLNSVLEGTTEGVKALSDKQSFREFDEYYRLLYVAMTRAKEKLIIGGYSKSGKIHEKSWYALIQKALV